MTRQRSRDHFLISPTFTKRNSTTVSLAMPLPMRRGFCILDLQILISFIDNIMECPITCRQVPAGQLGDQMIFCYETKETGKICFTDVALNAAYNLPTDEKWLLAGITRNRSIENKPPETITAAMVNNLMAQNIPYSFEAKARHFLKYLYDHGGKEYHSFEINCNCDSSIAYSSPTEFGRIIKYLEGKGWIDKGSQYIGFAGVFHGLTITELGISEVEKGKPKMPLFGLVSQEIATGDPSVDASIEQARKEFFNESTSFDCKRSACETLIYVLEPLRKELDGMFDGDTEYFFRIVNEFSVRHNKASTKRINNEEQLEWIFYSLLNTINTYVKMKRKGI